jgi:hypothetical protein
MLRDRYDPMNLFDLVPILSLAMDPVLTQLDTLLDDDRVEVILRMLLVKHLYGWSYEQTEQFVADSLVLGQFCRV